MTSDNLLLIHYEPKNSNNLISIYSKSVRQFFTEKYPHPLFHNHTPDGKSIYRSRGAPFQFKVINNEIYILALNEGIDFAESFQWPDSFIMLIGKKKVEVEFSLISKEKIPATFNEISFECYRNISPYLALNQEKHKRYLELSEAEQRKIIEKGLSDHILTAAKWCGVNVSHRIQTKLIQVKLGIPIRIKDNLIFVSFDVMFECNTEIPKYFGIGRFVSRGYGTVVRYG